MTWLLLVRPEVERDLAQARDWYDRKNPGLGGEFLDEIARAMREDSDGVWLPISL